MDMQAIYERLENIHPNNIDITSHFTAEELKDMPEIEQTRYKSIKLNYLVMLEFGKSFKQIIIMPEFEQTRYKSIKLNYLVMLENSDIFLSFDVALNLIAMKKLHLSDV